MNTYEQLVKDLNTTITGERKDIEQLFKVIKLKQKHIYDCERVLEALKEGRFI